MSAHRTTPVLLRAAGLAGLLSLAFIAEGQAPAAAQKSDKGTMQLVTSRDGTRIAYETVGNGPALILVNGALSTRSSASELAGLLSGHFTVYSYDRRGRGDSADTKPYSVERETEDLAALVDAAGGSAYVYGKSSGACLALEAAAALGDRIKRLALYEAPYSEAEGAAKEWRAFRSKLIAQRLAAWARILALSRVRMVGRWVKTSKSASSILSRMAMPMSQIRPSSNLRSVPSLPSRGRPRSNSERVLATW